MTSIPVTPDYHMTPLDQDGYFLVVSRDTEKNESYVRVEYLKKYGGGFCTWSARVSIDEFCCVNYWMGGMPEYFDEKSLVMFQRFLSRVHEEGAHLEYLYREAHAAHS